MIFSNTQDVVFKLKIIKIQQLFLKIKPYRTKNEHYS
jgi:hypothetical protein